MILLIDINSKIKLILLFIIMVLLIPIQVNAEEEKKINDAVINYKVSRSLENNWLGIDKIKKLDLTDDSVIPVPDLQRIPLLGEDLVYKQYNEYYTKYRFKNWGFQFFNQSRTNIVGSSDLIGFIRYVKNDIVAKNNLAIGYARNKIEYLGQEVSYSKEVELKNKKRLRLEITIKDLEGIEYYREKFSGVAIPKSDNSDGVNNYDYKLYGETEIYKPTNKTTSSGYGLDLKLKYVVDSDFYFQLALNNLAAKINWSDLEHQTGQISTDNITRDSNGNIDYNATMKGREEIIDLEQSLPQKVNLSLYFKRPKLIFYPQIQWAEWEENNLGNDDYITSSLKIIYTVSNSNCYYIKGFGHNDYLSLGMEYQNFALDLYTDHYRFERMKSLGITFQINYQF